MEHRQMTVSQESVLSQLQKVEPRGGGCSAERRSGGVAGGWPWLLLADLSEVAKLISPPRDCVCLDESRERGRVCTTRPSTGKRFR